MPPGTVDWNAKYAASETPWEAGGHCAELERVVREGWVLPCQVVELGCGTGADAVFLAVRGFRVTAVDVARIALERAADRAREAGVDVRLMQKDVLDWKEPPPPVPFVLDNGLYHILRKIDLDRYRRLVAALTEPGGHFLIFAGNSNEPSALAAGPAPVKAREICDEWEAGGFDLVQLREFRFHAVKTPSGPVRPLAWSGLFRRRAPSSR